MENRKRANKKQQELLVEKLHQNKEMARDNQAQRYIVNQLGCSRTVAQWQHIWTIWVAKVKTKPRKLQESLISTGGGQAEVDLTDIEKKILEIVGSASITGFTQLEIGMPSKSETPIMLPPVQPIHEHTDSSQPLHEPVCRTRGRRTVPRVRAVNNDLLQSLNENNRLLRETIGTAADNIAAALRENSAAIVRAAEILASAIQSAGVPNNSQ